MGLDRRVYRKCQGVFGDKFAQKKKKSKKYQWSTNFQVYGEVNSAYTSPKPVTVLPASWFDGITVALGQLCHQTVSNSKGGFQ